MKSLSIQVFLICLLSVLSVYARSIVKREVTLNEVSTSNSTESAVDELGDGRDIDFGTSRKLDVFFDEENTDKLKPVVIHVFGGFWFFGTKNGNFGQTLREYGYVGVCPDYILFPHGKVEDMVNDVYQTILWTHNNIKKYGGDPDNITITGHSSGAHLVALTTIKAALGFENLGVKMEPLPYLKKVVLLNGPYDFDDYSLSKQIFRHTIDNGFVEKIVHSLFNSPNVSPTDILRKYEDHSLPNDVLPKYIIVSANVDLAVPPSSAEGLKAQLERVQENPEGKIVFKFMKGYTHATISDGVNLNEKFYKELYISFVEA